MDICYTMNGMHTPKSIALAQTVHHLFRSKHLINLLSRLGHSINYDSLLDINNSIVNKIILEQRNQKIICPSNILPNNPTLFLHGAIDNNDFLEETLSGKNTTHVTSMTLYQEHCPNLYNKINIASKASVKDISMDLSSTCLLQHLNKIFLRL